MDLIAAKEDTRDYIVTKPASQQYDLHTNDATSEFLEALPKLDLPVSFLERCHN